MNFGDNSLILNKGSDKDCFVRFLETVSIFFAVSWAYIFHSAENLRCYHFIIELFIYCGDFTTFPEH